MSTRGTGEIYNGTRDFTWVCNHSLFGNRRRISTTEESPQKNHAVVHPGQSSTTIWRLIDRRIQSTNWTMYASINNGLLTNFIFSEAFLTEGTIINLKSVEPHSLVLPPGRIQVQPRLLWRGPCIRAWNHSSSLGRQLPHRPGQGPEELRYPTSNFYLCTWVVGLFIAIVGSQG